MFRGDKGFRKSAPIHEGEELDLTIEAVGEKGDGIAKTKGFVVFVPGVKQGDHVKVKITKVLRNFGFGEALGAGSAPAQPAEGKPKRGKKEEGAEAKEGNGDDDFDDENGDDDSDSDEDEDFEESKEEKLEE